MIDLHTHSTCSDGTVSPTQVVQEASKRGLQGLSLTDHNGLWGLTEAAAAARAVGLTFMEGIEISASWQGTDIHMLGYSQAFKREVLEPGLAATRAGYQERIEHMVKLCQTAGYPIAFEAIKTGRAHLPDPSYVSYDVTRQLETVAGLSASEARQLTVRGGQCYVPYGDWALSPTAAIELITASGGIAVLAHAGIIAHESGDNIFNDVLANLVSAGLAGIEVWHPFHNQTMIKYLQDFAQAHHLVSTGGSDWHGPDRFTDSDLGTFGMSAEDFKQFQKLVCL